MSTDERRSEMMLILLVCALSLSGVSEVQSSRSFPVCVPELRGDAEELSDAPPGRRPGRCPSPTPGASSRSPSPDPRTILHLHSVQEPLPAVSGLEAALCMSFSSLTRMVNDDFCPIFDHMAVCFIPPETADISGSLSVLSLFVFVGTQLSVSGHLSLGKRSR